MTGPTRLSVSTQLDNLKSKEQYRQLPPVRHEDEWIVLNEQRLLNISSNDYLGLGNETRLQSEFLTYLQQMPE